MRNRKNYRHYIASDKWRNSPARLSTTIKNQNGPASRAPLARIVGL
jgi:hypothetical protein